MATFKHLPTASLTRLGLALVKGGYRFSYDKCNRLTDAEYSENDSHEECQNYYDESIQKYDANDYIGSLVVRNGMPDMYLFVGGYYKYQSSDDTTPSSENSTGDLYFYNYDHLGNVREVVNEDGKLLQVNNYYPFGAPYSDNRITSMNPKLQPYKYTGKKLDLVHGLNTYDHGARQNYSILGVWDRVDPLAEKYYNISPYAVCGNNPILKNDLDGRLITDYIFNYNGAFLYSIRISTKDRVGIINSEGDIAYYGFADPRDAQDIDNGIINSVEIVSSEKIESMMEDAGALDPQNKNVAYMKSESEGGGKLDFSFSEIPQNFEGASFNPLKSPSPMLFLPEGDNLVHNHMNFGNFLWGAAGYSLGFSKAFLKLAAHWNSLFNSKKNGYKPQFDSKDDQKSISNGVDYAKKT